MQVFAKITSKFGGVKATYQEVIVPRIQSYSIDSAIDTDSDTWSIDIGDPAAELIELLTRDNEVRVTLVAGDLKNPPVILQTGFTDLAAFNQENTLSLQGRDVTAAAVDSTAPATNYTKARPNQIIKKQGSTLGIPSFSLAVTKPFDRIFTDGSESYWAFWYRMYRRRKMWIWAEPDGILVAGTLNYSEKPEYHFGRPNGKTPADQWIPVESVEVRKSTQTRVGEVWVLGAAGATNFDAKFKDDSIKDWVKKPLKIIQEQASSGTTGKKAALEEAKEEVFESKIGALELTITIPDPGIIIRQNHMAELNIPSMEYAGTFFIVGTTLTGGADGFRQQVRLREKDYAISARVPPDPSPISSTDKGIPSSGNIRLGGSKALFDIFQRAAKEWHGVWNYQLFLGVMLAICDQETGFRNVNRGGHTEWYDPPKQGTLHYDQRIAVWHGLFANSVNNSLAPGYPQSETAVGYMQLLTLGYKQYADRKGGKIIAEETNEYAGGRWTAEGNIFGGGFALNQKGAGFSGKNPEDIWKAVASYGEGAGYAAEVKHRYETVWRNKVDVAQAEAGPSADDSVVTQGSKKALANQILHNPDIAFRGDACKRSDISEGVVSLDVMKCILAFADAGFTTIINSLKCDHSKYTTDNHVSAHWSGLAVDFGAWSEGNSRNAMLWWNGMIDKLNIAQIIGPIESLVYPRGIYNRHTLDEHKNHIHIGF